MAELLTIALTFPCVVYTVLLGAALVYWLFVILGAARIELLGDGVADGALDGLDGGHAGHLDVHHAGHDGVDGGDGDGHAHEAHHGEIGGLGGILAALKLRSVPVTVTVSLLVLFSWLVCAMGMQTLTSWFPSGVSFLAQLGLFALSPIVALPFTSLAVRPLARVFAPAAASVKRDLIGKICTIRTGTVTGKFGEATFEDGGAGLVLRVRVEGEESLARGDRAIVVSYDDAAHEFTVTKADALLDEADAKPRMLP